MGNDYPESEVAMPTMMTRIAVDDYDTWKPTFDGARTTVRSAATGHRIYRGVEDPNQISVAVDFPTREDAIEARERLRASGMLERVDLKVEPTIVEEVEALTY
jgi:hypothetical protein